jgi:hypothetical protein
MFDPPPIAQTAQGHRHSWPIAADQDCCEFMDQWGRVRLCAIGYRQQPSRESTLGRVVAIADGRLCDLRDEHVQVIQPTLSEH